MAREYLDAVTTLMVVLNPDATVRFVNRRVCKELGVTEADLLGRDWLDVSVPTFAREAVRECFAGMVASDAPDCAIEETTLLAGNGELRVLSWACAPVRNDAGQLVGVVCTGEDVTERRRFDRAAALVAALRECSNQQTISEFLVETLDRTGELLSSPIGFYHFVDPDERTVHLQALSTATVEKFCTSCVTESSGLHYDMDSAGIWADCVRERRPVVHNDYTSVPNRRGLPSGHVEFTRELCVPIFRHGRIVAVLGVGNRPREYTDADVAIATYIAEATWEITQRKMAEEALREAECFSREVLDSLLAQVAVLDEEGRILGANRAWLELPDNRQPGDEILSVGANYLDACDRSSHPEMAAVATAIRDVTRNAGSRLEVEYSLPTDNDVRSFHTIVSRFVGPGPVRVVVTHRDTTKAQSTERTLIERSRLLEEAQRVARMGWYSYDLQTDYWSCSQVLEEVFGLTDGHPRTLIGWAEVVHPEDREAMVAYVRDEVVGAKRQFDREYRIQRVSDGAVRWVRGYGELDLDEQGNPLRLVGIIQDITERHRSEEAIRQSEQRYRALIEQSPVAIFVSRDECVDFANAACLQLFGVASPEQLVGTPLVELFVPEHRRAIGQRIRRLHTRLTATSLVEQQILRLDGSRRFVDVSAAPFFEGDETMLHVVLVDADQRKQAELAIRQHQERLSELASELMRTGERERRRLAVELHDSVGQTLAASKMCARSIWDQVRDDVSRGELDRLVSLIDQSLNHVRSLTAQLSPPALYELGLCPALEWLAEDVRRLYGLACYLDLRQAPDDVPDALAPVLFRAARELLSNVHRHSGASAARLTLALSSHDAILRVEDKGVGFTPEGYGAGLAGERFGLLSVGEDVRHAGGDLTIRSGPGDGTTVEVRLPLESGR
ncbi:MAG: PAS domain S-box protein [Actinobacteria bacterium]|nr:PAS domain S-box protein [Actinomycetota bacterium]